jgi:hypothetical protein
MIRREGPRAILRIGHEDLALARDRWNGPATLDGHSVILRTTRTWGTLLKGKRWIGPSSSNPRLRAPPREAVG